MVLDRVVRVRSGHAGKAPGAGEQTDGRHRQPATHEAATHLGGVVLVEAGDAAQPCLERVVLEIERFGQHVEIGLTERHPVVLAQLPLLAHQGNIGREHGVVANVGHRHRLTSDTEEAGGSIELDHIASGKQFGQVAMAGVGDGLDLAVARDLSCGLPAADRSPADAHRPGQAPLVEHGRSSGLGDQPSHPYRRDAGGQGVMWPRVHASLVGSVPANLSADDSP